MVNGQSKSLRALLGVPALAALVLSATSAQVIPGNPFPSLANCGIDSPIPDTHGKVTVVDFWASWCAPCRASFPAYCEIQKEFEPLGLLLIGVGVDEDPRAYAGFVAKLRPSFATVHDKRHQLVGKVQVPTMPTCYVIDRAGTVRFMHTGYHGDATDREIRAEVRSLLMEKELLQ